MPTQIQLRNGTAAAWTSANPVLAQGEVGLETDTLKLKIGNGVAAWSALTYRGLDGAPGGSVYQVDLDLGAIPVRAKTLTFTHAGATTSQRVVMAPAAVQPSPLSHDELEDEPLVCAAGVASNDTVRAVIATTGGVVSGVRRFYYTIGVTP